ncbi:hypothetical protein F6V30_14150 [Oryzomonas sagensis]|uniref:Transmembrane protein n=1 Tax=Oryzomonas sagensis TaxID=2603857 RepID=A0ABQ6TL91_9BACT|nr:hypothetical protein [Oryzomonas sagensis]KAB0668975.1 hypothetical protein F6V30_14150 [Oryzomonas sagensis]
MKSQMLQTLDRRTRRQTAREYAEQLRGLLILIALVVSCGTICFCSTEDAPVLSPPSSLAKAATHDEAETILMHTRERKDRAEMEARVRR